MDDRCFDHKSALDWIETVEGERGRVRESDLYPHLRAWVERAAPSEIMEIGCGQGICSKQIDLTGRNYTGIEPSRFLLERAKQLNPEPNKDFVVGTAYEIPSSNDRFDAAFSIAVWHLLEDKTKAARELSRVLKRGGHFLIVAANPDIYEAWTSTYQMSTRQGIRFEGHTHQDDGSELTDVLFLHTYDEIVASLRAAHLEVGETKTFRTALAIHGRKHKF